MALTAEDLNSIKHLFDDKFNRIDERFVGIDKQFAAVREDIDTLARASQEQFAEIDCKLSLLGDDTVVIKDIVKDYEFRIVSIEHQLRNQPS